MKWGKERSKGTRDEKKKNELIKIHSEQAPNLQKRRFFFAANPKNAKITQADLAHFSRAPAHFSDWILQQNFCFSFFHHILFFHKQALCFALFIYLTSFTFVKLFICTVPFVHAQSKTPASAINSKLIYTYLHNICSNYEGY